VFNKQENRAMKIPSLALLAVLATSAFAQDPPSRVARLNWLIGDVSLRPAGNDAWTAATLNYPLSTGDHLYTDTRARAEMHVGPNAIRLDSESNFGFQTLDDRTVQMRFTEGSMEVRVRRLDADDIYEIDTPQAAISLLRVGDYRVDTDPSRNGTMLTVWSGEAEFSANGQTYIVRARQTAYIPDGLEPEIRAANAIDDFDRFSADRNLHDDRVAAPVHVSESMVGYQDLDEYGSWNETPDYGWAWAPRVTADWAPYQQGRWCWVAPWGWTWIDEAPWGFAPFHYGRWAFAGSRWVWVPGAVVRHPVYAPALVVFVGPRGGVGWFPLGPREPYYPAYRVSGNYLRQVNSTHAPNVVVGGGRVERYANQHVPGAVIAVTQQGFLGSRPVRESGQRISPEGLRQTEVLGATPGVSPIRESVIGRQTNRTVPRPSELVATRPVATRGGREDHPGAAVNSVAPARVEPSRPVETEAVQAPEFRRNRPQTERQRPVETQVPERPDFSRQRPNRPEPEARPIPTVRPPEARPQPEIRRESAPIVREPRPESAVPRREERAAPVREQPRPEPRPESRPEIKKEIKDK
jgi:hypothetical protein